MVVQHGLLIGAPCLSGCALKSREVLELGTLLLSLPALWIMTFWQLLVAFRCNIKVWTREIWSGLLLMALVILFFKKSIEYLVLNNIN